MMQGPQHFTAGGPRASTCTQRHCVSRHQTIVLVFTVSIDCLLHASDALYLQVFFDRFQAILQAFCNMLLELEVVSMNVLY